MSVKIGVNGACGRMGARIIELAGEDPDLQVALALEYPEHPQLGADVGEALHMGPIGVPLESIPADGTLETDAQVIIDFSSPQATEAIVAQCRAGKIGLVSGTTGLDERVEGLVKEAAAETAVLRAPNMSVGVNVLFQLVGEAARMLADGFDVEIIEKHHRFKKDAPSGTALRLAEKVVEAQPQRRYVHGREGIVGERKPEELGIHAVRVGDVVGEHTVLFTSLGETIELTHKAHSRDGFVRGALRAAKFLAGRAPGLYSINDVLGL